jgi:hypothetical protein
MRPGMVEMLAFNRIASQNCFIGAIDGDLPIIALAFPDLVIRWGLEPLAYVWCAESHSGLISLPQVLRPGVGRNERFLAPSAVAGFKRRG